jgi:hypothetical protein
MKDLSDVPPIQDHEAKLERALIDEFLRQRGHPREELLTLPEEEQTRLLREARRYASERLAEIEARAHYVKEIHGEH